MTDIESIHNLFRQRGKVDKFRDLKWVRINPDTNDVITSEGRGVKYNCKTLSDRFVLYNKGYIQINVKLNRAALIAGDNATPKNSSSFITKAIVRLNNNEVDNMVIKI